MQIKGIFLGLMLLCSSVCLACPCDDDEKNINSADPAKTFVPVDPAQAIIPVPTTPPMPNQPDDED